MFPPAQRKIPAGFSVWKGSPYASVRLIPVSHRLMTVCVRVFSLFLFPTEVGFCLYSLVVVGPLEVKY